MRENVISTQAELLEKLKLQGCSTKEEIVKEFPEIADSLVNFFAIQKGGDVYRTVELEFFHNLTDEKDGHSTIKRIASPGQWFFHSYGFDLSFESNVERFGGILIRAISKDGKFFNGPGRVADRLFDVFDAFSVPNNFPKLVEYEWPEHIDLNTFQRWPIKPTDQKYRYTWPEELWPRESGYKAYPYLVDKK